jgi:hypothetical protein
LGDENYNNEPYKGIKTFTMTPGKAFAVMLMPNGKVQEVFDNPEVGGDKHPLSCQDGRRASCGVRACSPGRKFGSPKQVIMDEISDCTDMIF